MKSTYQITLVNVPLHGWKWGSRCQLRVAKVGISAKGLGHEAPTVYESVRDYDTRYRGPRSALGAALELIRKKYCCVEAIL